MLCVFTFKVPLTPSSVLKTCERTVQILPILVSSMSAPPSKSLKNLAGKWKVNKSLPDDISPVLELQGVKVLLRKAISSASVHLKISQPSESEIHIEQTATATSIPGTTEQCILDYQWRENKDAVFGQIKGRSRWIDRSEATEDGLKDGLDKLDEGQLMRVS